jgi:hypothetical protein
VFDRSIFHDCDIDSDAAGTKIVVNTLPVARYAVVPLESPSRLLVTFTPEDASAAVSSTDAAAGVPPPPDAAAGMAADPPGSSEP